MAKFKPGDLVRVKDGTHQEGMPDHRVAVIIEEVSRVHGHTPDVVQVLFLGQTQPLNFHVMFLEHFTTS
jgi:ribosomal protein L21E